MRGIVIVGLLCLLVQVGCGESGTGGGGAKKEKQRPAREYDNTSLALAGKEVTSEFRGQTYKATVARGGMYFNQQGQIVFGGIVSGKQVASNELSALWQTVKDSQTRCRILDYDPPKCLLEGEVEILLSKPLFIAPGSVIENATVQKTTVPIARPEGEQPYPLEYGETIEIGEDGSIGS